MQAVFVGIDPTAGRRPINYAVLDGKLRILSQGAANLDTVLDLLGRYPSATCAVDAPQSPNGGRMASAEVRARYGLPLDKPTWAQFKVCEYELKRRGIGLYPTPAYPSAAPKWMQVGFRLYERLRADGFRFYQPGAEAARRQCLEVHPHACFAALLGRLPFSKNTLEGRVQRQLVLFEHGVGVRDPMIVFEELTRHHLLQGRLSLEGLLTHDELDALVAAYTAFLAFRYPERVTAVGDPDEGQIIVPTGELKDKYQ